MREGAGFYWQDKPVAILVRIVVPLVMLDSLVK